MATLCNYKFTSIALIDNQEEKTNFIAKGYKDTQEGYLVLYFKNENEYKFLVSKDSLVVNVNKSQYTFDLTKKTEAIINNDGYSFKASINTEKLVITDNAIYIRYEIDFISFKASYTINLELL